MGKIQSQTPIGIYMVTVLNCVAGAISLIRGYFTLISTPFTGLGLILYALLLIATAIGLLKMKLWAWCLGVILNSIGIAVFLFYPRSIPLDFVVLPYLLIKRGRFR